MPLVKTGANKQIRTADLTLTKGALYQLSYIGKNLSQFATLDRAALNLERVAGIEPACSAWKADVLPLNYTRKSFVSFKRPERPVPVRS